MSETQGQIGKPIARFELHVTSAAEIEAAREAFVMRGLATFADDAEVAVRAAGSARSVSKADIDGRVAHPDDRVPLALLANPDRPWAEPRLTHYLACALTHRAFREAGVAAASA